jgi:NurA-like 5'-3' nuclease
LGNAGRQISIFRRPDVNTAELVDYVSPEQLTKEKESIEILKPFSETQELPESSIQIFTDTNFIEVFRISPAIYKLYVWPWGKDNEKPYV